MNYRHAFHAGNFADVFKHVILIGLLDALKRKPAAFHYYDTHAGRGRYDLRSMAAQRTGEADGGVRRILGDASLPEPLAAYATLIRRLNGDRGNEAHVYPGSPLIASLILRAQDRMTFCEAHDEEADALRNLFRDERRATIHKRDGYAALKALLPPGERRGLVLIDPPFEEQAREFATIEAALDQALARWATGTYAIWYPVKLRYPVAAFHRRLAAKAPKVLVAELLLHPDNTALRLNGCGLAIINPPWRIDAWLERLLPELCRLLAPGPGASQRLERLAES
jgi:23S rRNA (adenine2030-N6)-methyltransferase